MRIGRRVTVPALVRLVAIALLATGIALAAIPFHGMHTVGHPYCGSVWTPRSAGLSNFPAERACADQDYQGREHWGAGLLVAGGALAFIFEFGRWLHSPGRPRIAVAIQRRNAKRGAPF